MNIIEQYGHGLEIPKDELTAIERDRLLSEGKEVDRIMCCIDTGETLAPMIGLKVKDYYFSSEKMLELEQYIYDTFHSDGAGLSTTLRGMAEAMGSKIKYYDHNIAQLETPALASLDDVDQAKLVDVDKDGRLPIILKGLKMVKENLGDKVPVSGTVTGPFTIAAMVVGTENLLIGMIKKPDKVKQLMEVITENNERYIARMLEMGVGVGFADPVSTTSLLRVKQYKEFSLPYFVTFADFVLQIAYEFRKFFDDPLDHMKRIYNRYCVWKVLLDVAKIIIVHVSNEVSNSKTFFLRNGCEIWLCHVLPAAFEQIDHFSCAKVLNDQRILADLIDIQMHFVDADRIRQGEPLHVDKPVKYADDICIRSVELSCDICGRLGQIPEFIDDEEISCTCVPAMFAYEIERFVFFQSALIVRAAPAPLFQ